LSARYALPHVDFGFEINGNLDIVVAFVCGVVRRNVIFAIVVLGF